MRKPNKTEASEAPRVSPDQPLPRYLTLRDGIYWFKRKVPAAARRADSALPEQYWRSLNTTELNVALLRLPAEQERFQGMVDKAMASKANDLVVSAPARGAGTTKYLLESHIPALVARFEYEVLRTDDEWRKALEREDRAGEVEFLMEGLEQRYDQAAGEDYRGVEETVAQLLEGERLIAPPGSKVREALLKEVLAKDIELMEAQLGRLRGKITPTPRVAPPAPRELPTMLDLYEEWAKAQKNVRTRETYWSFVEEFEALNGAVPFVGIADEHVFRYLRYLQQQGVNRATAKNRLGALATLVRDAQSVRLISQSASVPFENLDFSGFPETEASELRRPYDMSELRRLFSSRLYTEGYRPRGQAAESSYWAPLLGLFVGCRIEELAQLRVRDLLRVNGVWALRLVNYEPDQHLKAESSFRQVPVHDELARCGFLRYAAAQKRAGEKLLFPSHANENKYERFGNALGKWYSRYRSSIGLNDPTTDFHSFRFTFKQQCGLCGIEQEVRDALTGHWLSKKDPGKVYMRGADRLYPFPMLVTAMQALRYGELDLSHLHVSNHLEGVAEAFAD